MTTNILLLLALIVGVYIILQRRREEQDAQAIFWTYVSQPFDVFPAHPFDETVEERAEAIRQNLIKHGNKKLNPATDVRVWLYRSTAQNMHVDFPLFFDEAMVFAQGERERYRLDKIKTAENAQKEFEWTS